MVYDPDRELIRRVQEGDDRAREALMERYAEVIEQVINSCLREYGSLGMPRGAIEGRLLEDLRRLIGEYRFEQGPEPEKWFHDRLFEELKEYLMSRQGAVGLPEDLEEPEDEPPTISEPRRGPTPDPGQELDLQRQEQQLQELIAELPSPKRQVIVHSFGLYGHEELPVAELSDRLQLSTAAVRELIQEGTQEIKHRLQGADSDQQ